MKKTKIMTAAAVLALATTGFWFYGRAEGSEAPAYRLATVERGNLESAVSATGTLGAVTTVQVGTQVSGQISAIYVDFNDRVKKGQLIARIDPTLQRQTVQDAQAGLDRARAQYEQARQEYERSKQLFDSKIVTASEFGSVESAYRVAQANVKSAQVTLDRARQNLAYTSIYAPIDGVVVERNVDVGQTVAASLSAPQLFLIANDLSRMQILASVDESDIGLIREGGTARFTVQAYPNETFTGTVRQVRLQSTTQENVVSYTAVVEVENPDGKLLPGMTATVSFLTGSAENVLMVPNAALRFRPTAEMLADAGISQPAAPGGARDSALGTRSSAAADGSARQSRAGGSPSGAGAAGGAGVMRSGVVWYLDATGKLTAARVRTGLSDGQRTEVQGEGIAEGTRVVIGLSQGAAAGPSAAASPFQQQQQSGPPRPGGF